MENHNYQLFEEETSINYEPNQVLKNISKIEWKFNAYKLQSWGNHIHRISPYVGRIKPSFAHFLIKYISKPNELILDPFCGIGTIPTEAALMGRRSIGIDLNPYAYCIAKAKEDNKRDMLNLIDFISNIEIDTNIIDLSKIPDWVRDYYNQDTLKEILFTIDKLKKESQDFLLGCLVGISQGHRPGHLSKPCAWTLPYKPRPDDKGEYRELKPRLIEKVKRTFKTKFDNMSEMKILLNDSRNIPLEANSIDHIISSPPYYDTLDYVGSHRLRLAILGYHDEFEKKKLASSLIQSYNTYLSEMTLVFKEFKRVLKPDGYCIIVVGDCFRGRKIIHTADELKTILIDMGFKLHGIVEDTIPINKSVQKTTSNIKSERIMILTK